MRTVVPIAALLLQALSQACTGGHFIQAGVTSCNVISPKPFPLRSQWAVDRSSVVRSRITSIPERATCNESVAFSISFMGQVAPRFPCPMLTEVATPSALSIDVQRWGSIVCPMSLGEGTLSRSGSYVGLQKQEMENAT